MNNLVSKTLSDRELYREEFELYDLLFRYGFDIILVPMTTIATMSKWILSTTLIKRINLYSSIGISSMK